ANIARALVGAAGSGTGSKSRTGNIPRSAGFQKSVLKQRRHWSVRRFEVPEDNHTSVETATRSGCERRTRWRISAMQAGTTPKKRTSLNRRAVLKLMRLDG